MIMARAPQRPAVLPLFAVKELRAIEQLQAARDQLTRRILALPPHSHRRIALQGRLAEMTARQLELEAKLRGMPCDPS